MMMNKAWNALPATMPVYKKIFVVVFVVGVMGSLNIVARIFKV